MLTLITNWSCSKRLSTLNKQNFIMIWHLLILNYTRQNAEQCVQFAIFSKTIPIANHIPLEPCQVPTYSNQSVWASKFFPSKDGITNNGSVFMSFRLWICKNIFTTIGDNLALLETPCQDMVSTVSFIFSANHTIFCWHISFPMSFRYWQTFTYAVQLPSYITFCATQKK